MLVWVLYIDLCILITLETSWMFLSALTSALETFTLPRVTMDNDSVDVVVFSQNKTKLKLINSPVCDKQHHQHITQLVV